MKKTLILFVSISILLLFLPNAYSTIIVALKLRDGIVIAADSRVIYSSGEKFSDTAEKIIVVDNYAVALYGLVGVDSEDLMSLTKDIDFNNEEMKRLLESWVGWKSLALGSRLQLLIGEKYEDWFWKKGERAQGGFILAGFDGNDRPQIWYWYADEPRSHHVSGSMGSSYGLLYKGQTDVISRLIYGVDEGIAVLDFPLSTEKRDLRDLLSPDDTSYVEKMEEYEKFEYIIPYETMSISEGIEFVKFLAQATITMQKYSKGTKERPREIPAVGGDVKILTITKDGLKWIQNK